MIDSYSIDVLDGKEKWLRLVTINAHGGEVYNRGPTDDIKQARRSNIEQGTSDYAIANNNIEPHATVRGWVVVEVPEGDLQTVKTRDLMYRTFMVIKLFARFSSCQKGPNQSNQDCFMLGKQKSLAKPTDNSTARPTLASQSFSSC